MKRGDGTGLAKWMLGRITTEVSPATSDHPYPAAPAPPLSQPETPPGRRRVWLLAVVGIVVAALMVWALLPRGTQRIASSGVVATDQVVRSTAVERRDFVRSLRLHGIVEAVEYNGVAAPRLAGQNLNTLVVTRLVPAGAKVKRGDLLVEFDRQNQIKAAFDRQAEYRDFVEQIKKKKAEHEAARAHDASELQQAENAVATALLEIKKNEVISRIDAEKNQQNLEEARAKLKQLQETLDLKRRAAQAELRTLEIQRDRALAAMRHAQANSEKMAIHAKIDGVVVLNTIWKGSQMGEVQEGDEVRAGVPFLQVINPAAMQVRVRVNQADLPYLRAGQPVQVRPDAYPDMVFSGKLQQIAAIGVTSGLSQKVRSFVTGFSVQGSDPRLVPDLSAGVDVELERRLGVLVVPRDAVVTEGGQSYMLVERGGGFEKRAVKVAANSDLEVVIESGVEPGVKVMRTAAAHIGAQAGQSTATTSAVAARF